MHRRNVAIEEEARDRCSHGVGGGFHQPTMRICLATCLTERPRCQWLLRGRGGVWRGVILDSKSAAAFVWELLPLVLRFVSGARVARSVLCLQLTCGLCEAGLGDTARASEAVVSSEDKMAVSSDTEFVDTIASTQCTARSTSCIT